MIKSNYDIPEKLSGFIDSAQYKNVTYDVSLSPKDILKSSMLPYMPIMGFDVPVKEMLEEAKSLKNAMITHRGDREEHKGWRSIVLHGISSAHTQGAEKYGMDPEDLEIYRWTDVSRLAPVTTAFFKNDFHYDWYHRVRIMLLEPGGYIMPHCDFDHYVLGPVNIALNNPEDCNFYMDTGGVIPFSAGTINKLALVNEHCVFNNSDEDRFHIIVHGCPNWDYWSGVYLNSYKEFFNDKHNKR